MDPSLANEAPVFERQHLLFARELRIVGGCERHIAARRRLPRFSALRFAAAARAAAFFGGKLDDHIAKILLFELSGGFLSRRREERRSFLARCTGCLRVVLGPGFRSCAIAAVVAVLFSGGFASFLVAAFFSLNRVLLHIIRAL